MSLPTGFATLDKNKTFTPYRYSTDGDDFDDSYEFKSSWDKANPEYVAEDAAELHWKDGGFEADWPITFKIWYEDGTLLGVFELIMEYEPVFSATKKDTPCDTKVT